MRIEIQFAFKINNIWTDINHLINMTRFVPQTQGGGYE